MTPNYASAIMLNNLVKSYNISISSTDYAQSTVEYCLAINNENSLKLNGLEFLQPFNKIKKQTIPRKILRFLLIILNLICYLFYTNIYKIFLYIN